MKSVILCGGEGTRLRPYTYTIPKPMLPLGNKPLLWYVLRNLKKHGVHEAHLTVGYLNEQISGYFGDGAKVGMKMHYSEEKTPMNTAGSVLAIKDRLTEPFIVQMGDHLSRVNLTKMVQFHKKQGGIATIAFKRQGIPLEYGIAHVDPDGHVKDFREKPIVENLINAGIYVFEPEIFDFIKPKEDFAKNVFPRLMAEGHKINAFIFDDFWLDIGRTADYEKMNELISVIEMVTDLE